jgi:hypothetical protein
MSDHQEIRRDNFDQGLRKLQGHIGCPGCQFCDEGKLGTSGQCNGDGYMTPAYQSPGRMECRNRRDKKQLDNYLA